MSQDPSAPSQDYVSPPESLRGTPPPNYAGTDPQGSPPSGDFGSPTLLIETPQYMTPDSGLPPQVQKASGMSVASKLKAAAVVGVLGVGGVVAYTARNEVSIDKIAVGQCLVDPGEGLLTSVTKVDCNEPHDLEVFALVNLEQGADQSWPGTNVVENRASEQCVAVVETFIGEDFLASVYDVIFITPVQEGWEDGDREGICAVINFDGSQLMSPVNP